MKTLLLCLALTVPSFSFAQDGGVVLAAGPATVSAITVSTAADGGVTQLDPYSNPLGSVREFYVAVKAGNYWWAAALMLFALVGALRAGGIKVHEWLGKTNPLDLPFEFLFDTKIGGWVMNWITSIGLCLGASAAAGVTVDMAAWKTAIFISTTGTTLMELLKDVMEWWKDMKAKKAAAAPAPAPVVVLVPPAPAPVVPTDVPAPVPAPTPAPAVVPDASKP